MRFDRQLKIVYLNRQSDRYNPNPVENMLGRTNREMGMPGHLCDLWDAAIERVFITGKQEELEFDFEGPSGMRTFSLKFAPEFGPDNNVRYVLGVSSDITERKRLEGKLKKYNETLEESVFKSTKELRMQQEHLQKLNENLLKSNKELESFAYITSHDLQEPLRMVTSYTQLLEQKYKNQLDESAKDYISFAVEGAKRMYDLINGLLEYSRISKKEPSFSKVDTNKVLDTVKANLNLVIKERHCKIETGKLPVILADFNQMIQLFQNLIANGIKFSNDEPHICISSKTEKTRYVFSVKDEGIGIESKYFNQIFEIFKRLNPREQFEGTGIGLAICKRIVENHNGEIWIESEPGKGSVFNFTLPRSI